MPERKLATLDEYQELLDERPRKFTAEEVAYRPASDGSVFRCASCIHYFRRAIDNFSVCEIFRNEETDRDGVRPDWRCRFWTVDLDVHPLLAEPETQVPEEEPQENQESLEDA